MKAVIAGLATALALGIAAPAVAQPQPRIIVVTHGQSNDPFWTVVKNGVAAAGKDANVQVDYRAPETFDMVAMGQLIDAAANQKPAGLVVSIPDGSALAPSIKKAVAAGVPVISMNSGSDVSKSLGALLHVGQDELVAGRAAGAKLKELGGKVGLCVNHEVGNVALDLRCKGFEETFGGKVTVLPVPIDPTELTYGTLRSLGQLDAIIAAAAGPGGGADRPAGPGRAAAGRVPAAAHAGPGARRGGHHSGPGRLVAPGAAGFANAVAARGSPSSDLRGLAGRVAPAVRRRSGRAPGAGPRPSAVDGARVRRRARRRPGPRPRGCWPRTTTARWCTCAPGRAGSTRPSWPARCGGLVGAYSPVRGLPARGLAGRADRGRARGPAHVQDEGSQLVAAALAAGPAVDGPATSGGWTCAPARAARRRCSARWRRSAGPG